MCKYSRIVNTHRCFNSCPQLNLTRNRTQYPSSPGRRKVHILLKSSIPHNSQYILNLIAESFSIQNIIEIHSTVFIPVLESTFFAMGLLSIVPMHTTHSFLGQTRNPLLLLSCKRRIPERRSIGSFSNFPK